MRSSRKSLPGQANKQLGTGHLRLFFLPFFLAGAGLFYGLTIRPALQVLAARDWPQVPCVIESGEVVAQSGKSTTYRIEIVYHYTFDDRPFTAKRYNFATGSSIGRTAKAAVVRRYPPGRETGCFVNPAAPEEAVLDRAWPTELAFGGIGLLFAIVGGLGIIFAGRLSRSKDPLATMPGNAPPPGEPGVLKPKYTPVAKFAGILIGATVWNGMTGVFVYLVFFAEGAKPPLFVQIVIGLFALIGVALICGVLTNFLALFNPRIRLTAPTTFVPLGGEFHCTWAVRGRAGMLRQLRLIFEGREEATYQRGTSTSTDTSVFSSIVVFETTDREFLTQGSARLLVPANLMHTFEAGRNKVLWRLQVQGKIPRWPDVADEYPITVLPQPVRS